MRYLFFAFTCIAFSAFVSSKSMLSCITSFKGNSSYSLYRTDHNGPYSKPFRVVKTTQGSEKVTVIDSYNLFYQNSFKLNSLKVKIEKSKEEDFELDKDIVLDNLKYMIENTKELSSNKIEEYKYDNCTVFGMTKKAVNAGTFVGNYVVFTSENLVCYLNFQNVKKDSSDIKTIEEFIAKRNQFFTSFDTSIKGCK